MKPKNNVWAVFIAIVVIYVLLNTWYMVWSQNNMNKYMVDCPSGICPSSRILVDSLYSTFSSIFTYVIMGISAGMGFYYVKRKFEK